MGGKRAGESRITKDPLLVLGDAAVRLKEISSESAHSVVTDPPYGLSSPKNGRGSCVGYVNRKWDKIPPVSVWEECLRILLPGGFLVSFGHTRTYHRLVVNIEDAGFEIRDTIAWVYGTGYPKNRDVGKDIDALLGAEREIVGYKRNVLAMYNSYWAANKGEDVSERPSVKKETFPITIPSTEEAREWDGWGTVLKPAMELIVLARKPLVEGTVAKNVLEYGAGAINIDGCRVVSEKRRYPPNLIHDGSEESIGLFPMRTKGSAARFFYCPKTNRKKGSFNTVPMVKPLDLMRWLVRLVTCPGGHCLDPYMGSGTTGVAAALEGCSFTGIELDKEHYEIAKRRMRDEVPKL